MKNILFSKALQHLTIEQAAEATTRLGFAGVDLTTRGGGHVEPSQVREKLPQAVAVCAAAGVPVTMLTTNIQRPTDHDAEAIFGAAAEAGVAYLKLGYVLYEPGDYYAALERMKRDAEGFATLAAKHGVCACHHIHSGPYMTQSALTLAEVLGEHEPQHLGAYADPCHMWIEGADSGWQMGMEALRGRIRLVAVKDFVFDFDASRPRETFRGARFVPLRQGLVAWNRVLRALQEQGYDGPLSFHMEYDDVSKDETLTAARDDLLFLTGLINEPGA